MRTQIKIILAILGVGIFGTSVYFFTRSKASELLAYVPNDATLVVIIGLPEIVKVFKENEAEIKKMQLWQETSKTSNDPLLRVVQGILKKPEITGIDFTNDAMYFLHNAQRGMNQGLLLKLSNPTDFAKFIKANTPAGSNAGNENGIEYAEFGTGIFISWNADVMLITQQKAEAKTYFADILNKKNPGAKGNILLSKVETGNSMMHMVLRIDDFFSSKDPLFGPEVHNPFPAGTAISGTLDVKPGSMIAQMHMISSDPEALSKLNFFKTKGQLGEYKNALFTKGTPYAAMAVSVDLNKLFSFISILDPKQKDILKSDDIKDLTQALSGDFAMGITLNENVLKHAFDKSNSLQQEENQMPVGMLLHIGIKNKDLMKRKLEAVSVVENGMYRIFAGFFTVYAIEYKDHFLVSMDKNQIAVILKNKGEVPINTGNFTMSADCKKAPFAIVTNSTGANKIVEDMAGGAGSLGNPNLINAVNGEQNLFVKDGVLLMKSEFNDKKTHPFLLYLRIMNETMIREKMRDAKMKEQIMQFEN